MISKYLFPVMLEDCNKWSDEVSLSVFSRNIFPTDEFINRRNAVMGRGAFRMRIVPGSVRRLALEDEDTELQYRASAILYKVYSMECKFLSEIGSGKIYHERYRMTAIEAAMVAAGTLNEDFAAGIDKPWNRPLAWIKDGQNIVLIRSEKAEDWMKQHSGEYHYNDKNILMKEGKELSSIIRI